MSIFLTGYSRSIQAIVTGVTYNVPKYLASVYTSSTYVGIVYYPTGYSSTQEILLLNYSAITSQTFSSTSSAADYIQKLIDEGYLEVIQDITEEEYEVQLALGTIIEGPRKICTKPNSRMKKKLATISGMNNL